MRNGIKKMRWDKWGMLWESYEDKKIARMMNLERRVMP